jgi:hypothetical protein
MQERPQSLQIQGLRPFHVITNNVMRGVEPGKNQMEVLIGKANGPNPCKNKDWGLSD